MQYTYLCLSICFKMNFVKINLKFPSQKTDPTILPSQNIKWRFREVSIQSFCTSFQNSFNEIKIILNKKSIINKNFWMKIVNDTISQNIIFYGFYISSFIW